MALVGEMQYLTIGNDTYSLPTGGGGGGSVTSVAVSNATNGGLSVSGSPITSSGTISIGHSNVLTSAQSTSAVYPITIDKNGHIASYGSAVTIPTITLNGSASTSPSFYAPTSAGTSGYVLISSGSGAPGWTSATLTDTKVTQTDNSTESTNRMLLMSDRAPSNNTTHDGGAKTSSYLYFQPSTGKLAAGYNTHNAVEIQPTLMKFHYSDNGSNYILSLQIPDLSVVSDPSPTITLPNKNGIIALTSDIPTVPTISLNGSSTTSPSFYAATGAGTSGQYLKSSGSGAPTWANFPTIPSITLNGASTTSPNFYAPTSAGTSGYYLKSNGSGAPEWAAVTAGVSDVTVGGTSVVTSGVAAIPAIPTVPTNVSAFTNDAGYLTSVPVSDVTLDGTSVVSSGIAALTSTAVSATDDGNGNVTLVVSGVSAASGGSF